MQIRTASCSADGDAIWSILEPTIQAAETYTLPADMARDEALAYWFGSQHEVFVATEGAQVLGTYFLQPNQQGGGSHVANCAHSLDRARERGFRAMQFNFVISTNEPAVHLWRSFGFEIVGRLPGSFHHPSQGFVDALVMYRSLL